MQEFMDGKGKVTDTVNAEYTEYDDHDNWLTCIIHFKDKSLIAKRMYEYY